MAEPKAPAIRVSRPYATEGELLEHEADTLTKSGIVLLGAHRHPDGTVLRFELTLADGKSVLRGEGRVTGAKTVGGEAGLALRFTRLDSKSKALVDRAAAFREARPSKRSVPANAPPSEASLEALPSVASLPTAEPDPDSEEPPTEPTPSDAPPKPQLADAGAPSPQLSGDAGAPSPQLQPPGERDAVLARLRERARRLSPEQVAKILASAR